MSATELMAVVVALLVMLVGLLGCVLPALPGTPLIFAAALIHRLVIGVTGPAWWVVIVLGVLTLLSLGIDFAASSIGAKQLGATWRGAVGAALGAVFGLLWMPFGLILGPFIGAALLEMTGGREWRHAGKAGVGAVLGLLAGTIGKVACSIAMIGLYLVHMLLR
jgi:uncharacterized protein YqgC (DUF456 family)